MVIRGFPESIQKFMIFWYGVSVKFLEMIFPLFESKCFIVNLDLFSKNEIKTKTPNYCEVNGRPA